MPSQGREELEKNIKKQLEKADIIIERMEKAVLEKQAKGERVDDIEENMGKVEEIKGKITKFLRELNVKVKKLGEGVVEEVYNANKEMLKYNIDNLNDLDALSKVLTSEHRKNIVENEKMDMDYEFENTTPKQFINKMKLEVKIKELSAKIKDNVQQGKETRSEENELKKVLGERFKIEVLPEPAKVFDSDTAAKLAFNAEKVAVFEDLMLNPEEALKNNVLLEEKAKLLETNPEVLIDKLKDLSQKQSDLKLSLDELMGKLANVSLEDMKNMLKRAESLQKGIEVNEEKIIESKRLYKKDPKGLKEAEDLILKLQRDKKRDIYDLSNWQAETRGDKAKKITAAAIMFEQDRKEFQDEKFQDKLNERIEKSANKKKGFWGRLMGKNSQAKKNIENAEMISVDNKASMNPDSSLDTLAENASRRSSKASTKSNESEKTISAPNIEK